MRGRSVVGRQSLVAGRSVLNILLLTLISYTPLRYIAKRSKNAHKGDIHLDEPQQQNENDTCVGKIYTFNEIPSRILYEHDCNHVMSL